MYFRFVFFILFFSIFTSCSVSNKIAVKKQERIKLILNDIALEKFKNDYKVNYNQTGEYAIVMKSEKKFTDLYPDTKYFVFSLRSKSIIIEDSLKAGNVYWENDYFLKAFEREQQAESPIYEYGFDVKNKVYKLD